MTKNQLLEENHKLKKEIEIYRELLDLNSPEETKLIIKGNKAYKIKDTHIHECDNCGTCMEIRAVLVAEGVEDE